VGRAGQQTGKVADSLHQQLGRFLRKRRGNLTLQAFARKLRISTSSLQRLELGEQNVTLKTLSHLLKRLKCGMSDVFDETWL